MEHALHGFGNPGGQADMPVRCGGIIRTVFQICGALLVIKPQLKIPSDPLFARGPSALRKEGAMSSGPGAYLPYSTIKFRWLEWLAAGFAHRELVGHIRPCRPSTVKQFYAGVPLL